MMDMMGAGMLLWSILGLVVLVLAVIGAVWAIRSISERDSRPRLDPAARPPAEGPVEPADPAQAELRRRYAAGEISREEYLQGKVDLE